MGLSILIPWADRPELAQTLSANAQVFAALEAEVLVANCGGDDSALALTLPPTFIQRDVDSGGWFGRSGRGERLGLVRSLASSGAPGPVAG